MREIIFRGKREDNGKWVYGNYVKVEEMAGNGKYEHYIIEVPAIGTSYSVSPETIGQFTGLTDKNNKKIFEGDIVQGTIVSAWNKALVRCEVIYNKDGFISVERTRNQDWVHKVKFGKDIEVIGNTHDNPELLEVIR